MDTRYSFPLFSIKFNRFNYLVTLMVYQIYFPLFASIMNIQLTKCTFFYTKIKQMWSKKITNDILMEDNPLEISSMILRNKKIFTGWIFSIWCWSNLPSWGYKMKKLHLKLIKKHIILLASKIYQKSRSVRCPHERWCFFISNVTVLNKLGISLIEILVIF